VYKNVLQTIQNVEIYPIISLVIFVLFFGAMLVWAFRAKKEYLSAMANLPLELGDGRKIQAREED
jgi:cytochrome c oxidase cbb3-type subunit IV